MTFATDQQFASQSGDPRATSIFPESIQPKTFVGSGDYDGTYPVGFPVVYDSGFKPWPGETPAEWGLALSATEGTFTLTIDGQETGDIVYREDYSSQIPEIEAALLELFGEGGAAVTDETTYIGIRIKSLGAGTITLDDTGLTDPSGGILLNTPMSSPIICGFFFPDAAVIPASDDVIINVAMGGRVLAKTVEEAWTSIAGNDLSQVRRALQSRKDLGQLIVEGLSPPTY